MVAASNTLTPAAQRFIKRHGEALKSGAFLCYSRKARKTLAVIAELRAAGLVDVHTHPGAEYRITAPGVDTYRTRFGM